MERKSNRRTAGSAVSEREPRLPWTAGPQPPVSEAPEPPADAAPVEDPPILLLVADAPMMRALLARVLCKSGYRVLEASGALEAQRLAATHQAISLLLIDWSLPEASDLQLALWFRATYPGTKVLVASDSLWELSYQMGRSHQIAFLEKPFTPLELSRMVERTLAA